MHQHRVSVPAGSPSRKLLPVGIEAVCIRPQQAGEVMHSTRAKTSTQGSVHSKKGRGFQPQQRDTLWRADVRTTAPNIHTQKHFAAAGHDTQAQPFGGVQCETHNAQPQPSKATTRCNLAPKSCSVRTPKTGPPDMCALDTASQQACSETHPMREQQGRMT